MNKESNAVELKRKSSFSYHRTTMKKNERINHPQQEVQSISSVLFDRELKKQRSHLIKKNSEEGRINKALLPKIDEISANDLNDSVPKKHEWTDMIPTDEHLALTRSLTQSFDGSEFDEEDSNEEEIVVKWRNDNKYWDDVSDVTSHSSYDYDYDYDEEEEFSIFKPYRWITDMLICR